MIPIGDKRQWHRNGERYGRGRAGEEERIREPIEVDGVLEKRYKIGEGEASIGIDKPSFENLENRPKKESSEERNGKNENKSGKSLRH